MTAIPTLSVMTYNAHLFGQSAAYYVDGARRETGFYFHDDRRLPQIIDSIAAAKPDLVGLTEIWDPAARDRIRSELSGLYPYASSAPAAQGIGVVLERTYKNWPTLAPRIDHAVGTFTRRHYSAAKTGFASMLSRYLNEDRMGAALAAVLRSGPVWGSGLLFLSRYPIVHSHFAPHRNRADWEHLAHKGVLWNTVKLSEGLEITVSLGHYQEGHSSEALRARQEQIRATREGIEAADRPALALGDFNVIGGSPEYAAMMSLLRLIDPGDEPTYHDPNPFQVKLKGSSDQTSLQRRLDYVLHSPHWRAHNSIVPREHFKDREGDFHLSDHDPVLSTLELGLRLF